MARVYSLWIFDRHCVPIYHQDWTHLHFPSTSTLPTSSSGIVTAGGGGGSSSGGGGGATSIGRGLPGGGVGPTSPSASSSSGLASIGATLQRAASGAVSSIPASSTLPSAPPVPFPSRQAESSLPGVTRAPVPAVAHARPGTDQRSSAGSQVGSLFPAGSAATAVQSTAAATAPTPAAQSDALPFEEEAKLVYGVVFSLRNMVRKLGGSKESFNSYTTSTYTLAHLHTATMYTFVLLTDPVAPPSSIPTRTSEGYSIGTSSSSTSTVGAGGTSTRSGFGTGGGIPGTGGMSLKGVLMQIYRGPWIEAVARNPLVYGLEREERDVQAGFEPEMVPDVAPQQQGEEERQGEEDGAAEDAEGWETRFRVVLDGKVQRREGIDSDAFREGVERVLAQNKLSAPAS